MRSVAPASERQACPECGTPESVRDEVCDLRLVVELAAGSQGGKALETAGRHAESLMQALRTQFLRDIGLPKAPEPAVPE